MENEGTTTTMQAVLDRDRITARIAVFGGVLVTRVFEGSNCYGQFLDFLKSQFGTDSPIRSSITVVAAGRKKTTMTKA